MKLETMHIKGEDGKPVLINKSDFDEKKQELYKEAAPKGRPKKDK
jgi:hypothetical protein